MRKTPSIQSSRIAACSSSRGSRTAQRPSINPDERHRGIHVSPLAATGDSIPSTSNRQTAPKITSLTIDTDLKYEFDTPWSRAFWSFAQWFHSDYLLQESIGLEHLPLDAGLFIIASSHASHLDCSSLCIAARQGGVQSTWALGARDYFFEQNPVTRAFVTHCMSVLPISRKGFTQRDVDILYKVRATAGPGAPASIVLFPEGTRSTDGRLQTFKTGVAYLALKLNVPVVPAFVSGSHAALPKGRIVPTREKITVRFGAPMRFDVSADATVGLGLAPSMSPAAIAGAGVVAHAPSDSDSGSGAAGGPEAGEKTAAAAAEKARKESMRAFTEELERRVAALAGEAEAAGDMRPKLPTAPLPMLAAWLEPLRPNSTAFSKFCVLALSLPSFALHQLGRASVQQGSGARGQKMRGAGEGSMGPEAQTSLTLGPSSNSNLKLESGASDSDSEFELGGSQPPRQLPRRPDIEPESELVVGSGARQRK